MKYIVTGGAGFIGSHLTAALLKNGHIVYVYDDLSSGYEKNLPQNNSLILIKNKIQDVKLIDFPEADGIFHLGAQASVPISIENFYESSVNNLDSSLKVFEICRKFTIPVVYASSSAIYGNLPLGNDENEMYEILSPYALDKLTLEQYSKLFYKLYNISSIGLRFFNVYGPRQDPTNPYSGVISIFIERFLEQLPIIINGGYQTRDFVYVGDIVNVIIHAMNIAKSNSICDQVNVGTGLAITIDELYNKLSNIFNYKPEVNYKKLPEGDPDKSGGVFNKLSSILKIDTNEFKSVDHGLLNTVDYFKKIKDKTYG